MITFLKRCLRWGKRKLCLFLVNKVLRGTKYFALKRILLNYIGFQIGHNTKVVGPVECSGKLKVGDNCWIGKNLIINGNGLVEIGDNCDIAPEVTFLTGGHEIGDAHRRAGRGEIYSITVGNGVWIGARSTLMKNITVGNGAIVAACACVHKSVQDNEMVGGIPARVIRKLEHDAEAV